MSSRTMEITGVVGRTEMLKVDPRSVVIRDGWNPRQHLQLDDLIESIRANGVMMPIRVRKGPDNALILIDGERRLRSCLALIAQGEEIVSIPALLEHFRATYADLLVSTLVSNQGLPLDPLEEAEGLRRLIFYGMEQTDIAKRIGRSQGYVSQRLLLLQAETPVRESLQAGDVTKADVIEIIKTAQESGEAQTVLLNERKEEKLAPRTRQSPGEKLHAQLQTLVTKYGIEAIRMALRDYETEGEEL